MALSQSVASPADVRSTPAARRRHRYEARSHLWRESSLKRVAYCGRFATGDSVSVRVTRTAEGSDAGLGGVQSCGSVWACPVCSEKVNAGRHAEIAAAINVHTAAGGAVVFGTATLRHNRGHRLADLWDAIGPAWNRTTSGAGRQWKADRATFGILGYLRIVEVKLGHRNGWHPHVHFLLFLDSELTRSQLDDLSARMYGRWEAALADRGFSVIQSVGLDLRPVTDPDYIADYLTKHGYRPRATSASGAAYEVTGSVTKREGKGGRTPFELLAAVVDEADADALDKWHEYEKASHNRRQMTWSRGLRAMLQLAAEKTDQELVEDDQGGAVEVTMTKHAWRVIASDWSRVCDLLDTAEADPTGWRLHRLLSAWGLRPIAGSELGRHYDLPASP